MYSLLTFLKADFHSVEFSDGTGNPLFACENVALNVKRMLRVSNNLFFQIQSARKILLSGNQPLDLSVCFSENFWIYGWYFWVLNVTIPYHGTLSNSPPPPSGATVNK